VACNGLKAKAQKWWRRGELEYSGVLKTSKLLKNRHAQKSENAEIVPNWSVSGTREFSIQWRLFRRPSIEELRQDLRAVLKKCRPDWDITGPELKAAWEQGEQNRFYPYGKTYGQVFREQE
jgi:hypothetical protein